MKKLLFTACMLIALFLPLVQLSAHEEDETGIGPTTTPTVVNYKLPYPGMLPDNKLYILKVLRDKLMLALIQDPQSKAQYYLNLANKELVMSEQMLAKKDMTLAKKMALRGENEMTLLTYAFKNARQVPSDALFTEAMLASAKHQELLSAMVVKAGSDAKTFQTVLEFSKRNAEELQKIHDGTETK